MKKKMIGYLTLVTVWCNILLPKPLVYAQGNIEEIATIQEDEIILPARGTYDCKIHVQMPEKAYTGIQAGAIRFLKKNTEQPKGNVNNQFAREIRLIQLHSLFQISTNLSPKDILLNLLFKNLNF